MNQNGQLPGFIQGPAGKLQLKVDLPKDMQIIAIAVICHPHSLHGGTLDNKVVYQLARSFNRKGAVSIRFNFRGVGNSDGTYDEGNGEQNDLLAVIEWTRLQWPDLPVWLGGFSFGSYVALKAQDAIRPEWLVTVAPPVVRFPMADIDPSIDNWLLIQGMQDEVVSADDVLEWAKSRIRIPHIECVSDAGHFFHGRLMAINELILAKKHPNRDA